MFGLVALEGSVQSHMVKIPSSKSLLAHEVGIKGSVTSVQAHGVWV